MQILRRTWLRKTGGFAALCAILLLSFAPLVSHALEHHLHGDAFDAALCAASGTANSSKHDTGITHLRACGYCDLVAHAPTPPLPPHDLIDIATVRESFVDTPHTDTPRSASHTHAQPRAPPAFA
jgi:hypothetical protein